MGEPRSLAGFIQKHAKVFIALLAALLGAVIVFFAAAGIMDASSKKQIAALEVLIERNDSLVSREGSEEDEPEINALISDLKTFADSARGYPKAKAYSLIGYLQMSRSKWGDAEAAFEAAANAGAKTHLYGISLYNAAVAADESGNTAKAIDYFTKSINAENAGYAARAQFSIGRLNEKKGDAEAARAAYRAVIDNYTDYFWTNLAHSRLLALEDK